MTLEFPTGFFTIYEKAHKLRNIRLAISKITPNEMIVIEPLSSTMFKLHAKAT